MSKKGAIELSMSTIIVVILGVTLLSLGLVWIRGNLNKIEDVSDQAFDLSEQAINDIFSDSDQLVKILPDSLEISKNKEGVQVGVVLYNNIDGNTPIEISVRTEPISNGQSLNCEFADTFSQESDTYTLNPGQSYKLKLIIEKTPNTGFGSGGCRVTPIVPSYSGPLNPSTVTVTIPR